MKNEHKQLLDRVSSLAGRTDQAAIREIARAAASPPVAELESPLDAALVQTAKAFTSLLSQTFQAVAWNKDVLYDETGFQNAYARVLELSKGFSKIQAKDLASILRTFPPSILVFRLIAALSLDEISTLLQTTQGVDLSKDIMREFELGREVGKTHREKWNGACDALGRVLSDSIAGNLLELPAMVDKDRFRERKAKPDTLQGWEDVRKSAEQGVDYWILLYQRYVGGFFRQAMDASSSIKGDILEDAIVSLLQANRIPFYRTRPREKIPGWEQAPDFLLPNRDNPTVAIEAKLAEDGGTARDKAARIERLCREAQEKGVLPLAVIDGKGFYRINDVTAPIIRNTLGETYTLKTVERVLEIPKVASLRGKQ